MRWYGITDDRMPVCGGTSIERNTNWIKRPFESGWISGGFIFSHGHYIHNAGYSDDLNNVFQWEEPYQTYLAWKAGYKLYSPTKNYVFHLYDRSYRPAFASDKKK